MYRSILENNKLTLEQKIELRDFINQDFDKTYNFLQLKDPDTYLELETLGRELTKADRHQLWQNIRVNQQKILANKQIKHRNFGIYSKHNCGYEHCVLNGVMIKQGSILTECEMFFDTDKPKYFKQAKIERKKTNRGVNYKQQWESGGLE